MTESISTATPPTPLKSPADVRTPRTPTRKLRILQLGASLAIGGSERLMVAIGKGLDPQRFETLYAAVGHDGPIGERLRAEGQVACAFERRAGFDYRLYARIWKLIRSEKIDVVQTHHVTSLIYGGLPAKMAGAKLVHTEHDTGSFERYPRNLAWLRRLKRLPDRFVAIDPAIGAFFREQIGVPAAKIAVIRNGIDLDQYAPNANHGSNGWDPDRPFVVGWIGRLDVPKRPDVLVEAIARLIPIYSKLKLVVVGPGTLLEPTRHRAAELGLSDRIEFLGAQHNVADRLRAMDCCVLVSEREGLPFTLVEAMATALPCIASAVGGIPDLVKHESNGLLYDGFDPDRLAALLRQIIDRPEWARGMGRAARTSVLEKYDFRTTAREYTDLFCKLTTKQS